MRLYFFIVILKGYIKESHNVVARVAQGFFCATLFFYYYIKELYKRVARVAFLYKTTIYNKLNLYIS